MAKLTVVLLVIVSLGLSACSGARAKSWSRKGDALYAEGRTAWNNKGWVLNSIGHYSEAIEYLDSMVIYIPSAMWKTPWQKWQKVL